MITVKKLKILVFVKGAILTFLISSIVFSHFYFAKKKSKFVNLEKSAQSALFSIESNIDSFNAKTKDIAAALATWEDLTNETESFTGLKISVARNIIESLKETYKFNKIDINMSKPELSQSEYIGDAVGSEFSKIKIIVKSSTDIQLYYFIYELRDLFPGYLVFDSYSIKSERPLDQNFLLNLDKNPNLSSINANIELTWQALKELE